MAGGEEINTPHTAEKEGEYQQTRGGAGHWNDAREACWSLSVEGGAFVGRELTGGPATGQGDGSTMLDALFWIGRAYRHDY